ncbi:hypothetical protein BB561_003731 [Smittium simulii]|uniref:peptidylprolyl isomerase n=1 Tax=Smittium simulii TaxID=133385 RepID=A0A2T9YJS9_9FUNG|nr:hypothetical protein BB561_003731 [Smittium simulii]
MDAGFWGLAIKPENSYSQTVDVPFRVTNIALGSEIASKERGSVLITVDDEKFVLCSLTPGSTENQIVDITLNHGEQVTFESTGKNEIHLVGNYVEFDHDQFHGGAGDSEDDSDDDLDSEDFDSDDYDLDGLDSEDYPNGTIEEINESEEDEIKKTQPNKASKKRKDLDTTTQKNTQKVVEETVAKVEPSQKKQNKKAKKAAQQASAEPKPEAAQPKSAPKDTKQKEQKEQQKPKEDAKKPAKKQLPGGLVIEDKKIGTGAPVKKGQRIGMYYVGKLASNGKQFDSCTKGKPFIFTLGRGEVIKGWDMGVAGMLKGGERRLTIPASLGYGSRGAPPDIPGNATLIFDVRVAEIK